MTVPLRMKATRRYLDAQVRRDLARKMVFVAGPRQVSKTTLAQSPAARQTRLSELGHRARPRTHSQVSCR
jgi:predicted AAA+ superfamily ATPase